MLQFLVLGPLEALRDGRLLPLGGPRQRALLGLLLLHPNEVVPTERLIDALWHGSPPATARQSLQNHVWGLRKLLEPPAGATGPAPAAVVTRDPGYLLAVDPDRIDAQRFRALVARGREALAAGDLAGGTGLLRDALALWRGPALAEEAGPGAAWPELAGLEELRLAALEDRIEGELALGRHDELIAELQELVPLHPLREHLRGQLMLALYRAGRRDDALACYADAERALVEELGIEPSVGLQRLEGAIVAGDLALDLLVPVRTRADNRGPDDGQDAADRPEAEVPGGVAGTERKVVTVLFCDLDEPSGVGERDPEDVGSLLGRDLAWVRAEVEGFGGTVEHVVGTTTMAVFGVPSTRADDPERAVRAALAIREALAEEPGAGAPRPRPRAAVATGEALVRPGLAVGDGRVAGDLVTTCARLQAAAPPGTVLVCEWTERATERAVDYGPASLLSLEGRSQPLRVWSALAPRQRAGLDLAVSAPLVGRADELAVLLERCREVRRLGRPQLVTVVGPPGIGKTRLVAELGGALQDEPFAWRLGRCLPYGDGGTFSALVEIVEAEAGILDSDDAARAERKLAAAARRAVGTGEELAWVLGHLRLLLGLVRRPHFGAGLPATDEADLGKRQVGRPRHHPAPATHAEGLGSAAAVPDDHALPNVDRRGEVFAAWRRFLYGLAAREPLVLAVEDLHWADDAVLDFLEELVDPGALDRPGAVPVLLVAAARPELDRRRPAWREGAPGITAVTLGPLGEGDTERLLEDLLARNGLPATVAPALLARVGGNALFAEEYVRMLRDRGGGVARARSVPGWPEGDAPPGGWPEAIPGTVHAIIAARLDSLPAEEKLVLQDAAVLGRAAWPGALAMVGGRDRAWLEGCLRLLVTKEFVHRVVRSSVAGEPEYRFRHVLVRDVAYGQIPRAARAGKHRRAAAWIESLAEGRAEDRAELLAHHYLAALASTRQFGPDAAWLAERARLALRDAGDRAAALGVYGSAVRSYERALELWPERDPQRPDLQFRAAQARFYAERPGEASSGESASEGPLTEARDALLAVGERVRAAQAEILLAYRALHCGQPDRWAGHPERAAELVRDAPLSRARAMVLKDCALHLMAAGRIAEGLAVARQAQAAAEPLGLADLESSVLGTLGTLRVATGDPGGIDDLERAIAALERLSSAEVVYTYFHLAYSLGTLGQVGRAAATVMAGWSAAARLGSVHLLRWMEPQAVAGFYWTGHWSEALALSGEFLAGWHGDGPHYLESTLHVIRALIRLAQGDDAARAEADQALALARAWGDAHSLDNARGVAARVALADGRVEAAGELAAELLADLGSGLLEPGLGATIGLVLAELGQPHALDGLAIPASRWLDAARALAAGEPLRAAAVYAEIGSRPDEADARLQAGRRLLASGHCAEAKAELDAACAFYREVGAAGYLREVESLLAAT